MLNPAPEPRVYFGLQALQGPHHARHRGFARTVREYAAALLRDHRDLVAALVLNRDLPPPNLPTDLAGYGAIQHFPSKAQRLGDEGASVIYHIPSPTFPYGHTSNVFPAPFLASPVSLIVTIHDLVPLILPQFYLPDLHWRNFHDSRYRLLQEADHVLAVSQSTKNDAVRLLGLKPERVTVAYNGVGAHFRLPVEPPETVLRWLSRHLPKLRGSFVLSMLFAEEVGRRKNMEAVLEAFAGLPREIRDSRQLVMAGSGLESDHAALTECARKSGIVDSLVFTDLVSDETLCALYQACDLFVFPSLYEGFGLPVIEAMRCGAPVIVSDRPAMNELVEISDARFDPHDAQNASRVMARALTDTGFRSHLRDYGLERSATFTWERTAQITADCYRDLAASTAKRWTSSTQRKRRMAFCLPPAADFDNTAYCKSFLSTLTARHPVQVETVQPEASKVDPRGASNQDDVSPAQFSWLAERGYYDYIVYFMDNGADYDLTYKLLKKHRGDVWLNQVRLTDFYRHYYSGQNRDVRMLPDELAHWARNYPDHRTDVLLRDLSTQYDQGIYLAGEIVAHADRTFVNSRFSKELTELDAFGIGKVVALPFAAPLDARLSGVDWQSIARKYGLRPDSLPIVAVGPITATTCPEVLIAAIAEVARTEPSLVLALLGSCQSALRRELERRADEHQLGNQVIFTGDIEEAEVVTWLSTARCAVQLIFPTSGESSVAVMRCLAAGTPTIVSDHGAFRDLPDDAAFRVSAPTQPNVLAASIRLLLTDETVRVRLGQAARRFSSEATFDEMADKFWQELIAR